MLYLLGDKIIGPVGLRYAQSDPDGIIVLIKDGIFLNTEAVKGKKIYAIDVDVERRGMQRRLQNRVEIIGYDKLVDLVLENKVVNFV